eukprot:TRINITY_DN4338_c0_g3_i4.p2 TRINITY_DN4338_c0_g3~~TRINITY_DN4338_c0_g3_i4.p2  ORF type:complete len:104 (-),score=19.31 TRINITY_DN4338_c0_g3_i4:136-447(-)
MCIRDRYQRRVHGVFFYLYMQESINQQKKNYSLFNPLCRSELLFNVKQAFSIVLPDDEEGIENALKTLRNQLNEIYSQIQNNQEQKIQISFNIQFNCQFQMSN